MQYNRPLPPVPSHRERLANSGSQHAQHHPLSFNLSVRQRKKRPLLSENGDENGGYTIRHDGTDVEVVRFAENSRIKEKKKARLQKDDNNPFKLMPCASFGSDRPVIIDWHISWFKLYNNFFNRHLFKSSLESKLC